MKRMIIAALVSLSATLANAQDAGDYDATARAAIEAQDKANNDLINGARMRIESGNRADVIAGLEALQNHLSIGEKALDKQELTACPTMTVGGLMPLRQPCNPYPALKRTLEKDFNQRNWPVAASPSAAFGWMADQYNIGSESTKKEIVNYAGMISWNIAEMRILPAVEVMNGITLRANSVEARREARQEKIREDSSILGNFSSVPERAVRAFWTLLSSFLIALFLPALIFRFMPLPADTQRKARYGLMVMFIMIVPFALLYVAFGGFWNAIEKSLPGWIRWVALFGFFIPACFAFHYWFVKKYRMPFPVNFLLALANDGRSVSASPITAEKSAGGGLHGSAHWTTTQQAIERGRVQPQGHVLADSHGFALGRVPDAVGKAMKGFDSRVRYMGHLLTCAPNGKGKGVSGVIPTLLDYPGSTVVLDVKGENYAVTARRRREMGHEVYLVDPFGVIQSFQPDDAPKVPVHRFNWLDRLDPDSPDVVAESLLLADMLIVASGHASGAEIHFNDTARNLIAGVMVHVATFEAEKRNMGEVSRLMNILLAAVTEPSKPEEGKQLTAAQILRAKMLTNERGFGLPRKAIQAYDGTPDRERGSMMSTAMRHLKFLDDPRIIEAISATDFSIDELKRKPMTIYLVMPPNRLEMNARFVRAFFGQAIMSIMASAGKPDYRVLFLLDEFAQLGKMDIVEEKLPLIRGYGATFWLIVQNLAQLKETYPKWQNFMANCGAKQYFGTSDFETAKYISDSLGKKTVEFQTENSNSGASFGSGMSTNSGAGKSQQFTGRELLTPDEIETLPPEKEIVLISGEAPYLLDRLNYLRDAEYAGQFDPNPYEL